MIRLLPILLTLALCFPAWAYDPPKGIPDPAATLGFEIDVASPDAAAIATMCPNWPSATNTNCWYFDNTTGCTDSGNGTPNAPRCSFPNPFQIGDVSETGGYVYVATGTAAYTGRMVSGVGSSSKPIWIVGDPSTKPTLSAGFTIGRTAGTASYIIVENFQATTDLNSMFHVAAENANTSYILIRNMKLNGTSEGEGNPAAVLIGNYEDNATYTISKVVVYNSEIKDYGVITTDAVGVEVYWNSSDVWILNNTILNIGGDDIGGCHLCNTDGKQPHKVFIGGNTLGVDVDRAGGENCIDHKGVHDIIISENSCRGKFDREQGWGIVLHDSEAGTHPAIENAWVIFNKFYHVSSGVGVVSDGTTNAYIVGNLFYDIGRTYCVADCTDGWSDNGVFVNVLNGDFWVIDNTFYNYDTGVRILPTLAEGMSVNILGNLFSSRADSSGYEITLDDNDFTYATINRNLFYHGTASAFRWSNANKTYDNLTAASQCGNCLNGSDPLLTNPASGVFTLQAGSPAIGANVENPAGDTVYDKFTSVWAALGYSGLSIKYDNKFIHGTAVSRPQGGSWDIGAYEYDPGAVYPAVSIGAGAGVSIGSGATMTLY